MQRKLTAILAADVVGYNRLMGEDEVGTLDALKAHHKELLDPKTCHYFCSCPKGRSRWQCRTPAICTGIFMETMATDWSKIL